MGLRTAEQYVESLRDNRRVYFRGLRVPDVTAEPELRLAIDHAAIDFLMAEEAELRDLAVVQGEDGEPFSRFYQIPRSPEDLLRRSELIEAATARGGTLVTLVKEIGSDAVFALRHVAFQLDQSRGTSYFPRVEAFYRHCRENDLAVAVAQTDVKGDRGRLPSEQAHPDYYLRIVSRNEEGLVVRGAKAHTSVSMNANELIVLPTRSLPASEAAYAVAFAIPVDTPGLRLIASSFRSGARDPADHPISARHNMVETLTVFDDVFVPWDRVFLAGEAEYAGPLARTFVQFHRFTAVSYKLPLVDALLGAGALVAELNGIARAGHVREKLVRLATYAAGVRQMLRAAAHEGKPLPPDAFAPDELAVNLAKFQFAQHFHEALREVQDLAGGLLVTAPAWSDVENPETREDVIRYLGAAAGVDPLDRLRVLKMISDLSASDFGGYQQVLAVHAEGSLEAEKLAIARGYPLERAVAYARRLAGLAPSA